MPSRLIPRREARSPTARPEGISLVGDPQREAVRRLRLLSVVATVVPSVSLCVMLILSPRGSPIREAPGVTLAMMVGLIAVSGLVHRLLGRDGIPLATRLDIGFGYQVVVALMLATVRHSLPWAPGDGFREVSPVALLIVFFAALVPNPPRRTFFASMAAALMEPVGLGISIARGNPLPAPEQIAAICAAPIGCAVGATLISGVIYGLARSVDAARRMGSYRLVTLLGRGGMGEVWKAEHDLLARPAAIKLIRASGEQTATDLQRFQREAQATAALRSPHTIQLYDFGVAEDGTFYYVMELLDGVDLERMVRETGPLPPERAVHILRQICRSLDEAHHQGLVHRDIKPANILLCNYGLERDFVKVLDFGLVKSASEKDVAAFGPTVTHANAVLGTPAYMAPEMVLTGAVDERADIYALGCVAYWLLAGRLVFEGDSMMKVIVAHVHDRPTPPSQHAAHAIPEELDRLILELLEKDPASRPAKMFEIERRLAALELRRSWSQELAGAWWAEHPFPTTADVAHAATETA